jgi:hypothetical protein
MTFYCTENCTSHYCLSPFAQRMKGETIFAPFHRRKGEESGILPRNLARTPRKSYISESPLQSLLPRLCQRVFPGNSYGLKQPHSLFFECLLSTVSFKLHLCNTSAAVEPGQTCLACQTLEIFSARPREVKYACQPDTSTCNCLFLV